MRKKKITGTEAARPFREKVCPGRDLAKALAKVKLTPTEAAAWQRDLKAARKCLTSLADIQSLHPAA